MREYAKVAPQFWTGKTGKALKAAGPEAVIVGLYLMTSPHANMIGVYHCPLAYIAFDTGLGLEGASKGLQSAIEAGFCTYEADSDYVFVHEFAAYQIGGELDPKDNRCKGINSELEKVPEGLCSQGFRARYGAAFKLICRAISASPFQAPSKPLPSQEQEQEKEQKKETSPAKADGDPEGFAEFWSAWPATPRKQDRKKCAAKWKRSGFSSKLVLIVAHVEDMKRSKTWRDGFEPAPLTYLNGERWADGAFVEAVESEGFI